MTPLASIDRKLDGAGGRSRWRTRASRNRPQSLLPLFKSSCGRGGQCQNPKVFIPFVSRGLGGRRQFSALDNIFCDSRNGKDSGCVISIAKRGRVTRRFGGGYRLPELNTEDTEGQRRVWTWVARLKSCRDTDLHDICSAKVLLHPKAANNRNQKQSQRPRTRVSAAHN